MAGALSLGAPGDVITPGGSYAMPNDPGYTPYAGAMSVLGGLQQPRSMSPEGQGFLSSLYGLSGSIMPSGDDVKGALSSVSTARNTKSAATSAAIERAMKVLQAAGNGTVDLPLLAWGSAMLQPGPLMTNMGSAGNALGTAIGQQRERQRQNAMDQLQLSEAGADVPYQQAVGNAQDVEGRLNTGLKLGQTAGTMDYHQATVDERAHRDAINGVVRLTAAEITGGKNRYKFIGNSPENPNVGIYLDTLTNAQTTGPAAGGRPGGAGAGGKSVFQQKIDFWLSMHPNDKAGAADYASGRRSVPEEQLRHWAYNEAQNEARGGAIDNDKDTIDARAAELYRNQKTMGASGGSAPSAPAPSSPVVGHPGSGTGPAPGVVNPPSDGFARPQTQDDFNRLPKGAKFINPADGKPYVKQ